MSAFDCSRCEEMLSDLHEDELDPVLRPDVLAHLRSCSACRALNDALAEVMDALRPGMDVAPSADLAERAATAALRAAQAFSTLRPARVARAWRAVPLQVQALAAVLALVVSGAALVASGQAAVPAPRRMVNRVVNTGVYLVEKKDRVVEDIRILRVVLATAFEGRLDRMNDRVDDYRRLLERRRLQELHRRDDGKKSKAGVMDAAGLSRRAQI